MWGGRALLSAILRPQGLLRWPFRPWQQRPRRALAPSSSAALSADCLGFALYDTEPVEQTRNAVRRLCALGDPGLCLLGIEHEAIGGVLGLHRIERAELLDEAAITRHARIRDDDAIEGALLGATTGETNFQRHCFPF